MTQESQTTPSPEGVEYGQNGYSQRVILTSPLGAEADKIDHTMQISQIITQAQAGREQPLPVERSDHGYPVVDLAAEPAESALDFLCLLDSQGGLVYHGVHNNEFRRNAGMDDVGIWDALDPSLSHQPDKGPAVYATTNLKGGLVHAVLEHKQADANPVSGETYSLMPDKSEDGTFIEASPHLAEALARGDQRFTDGLLYVLPADKFIPNPNSNHEVVAREKITPLAVIRVGQTLGPKLVTPDAFYIRET